MKAGLNGTFVISWSQTEIDGLDSPPLDALRVGAAWSWRGDARRVVGSQSQQDFRPGNPRCQVSTSRRGSLSSPLPEHVGQSLAPACPNPPSDGCFVVTDGAQSYSVMLLETGSASAPYLMFQDELPPRGTDLWVMRQSGQAAHTDVRHSGDKAIICFTPGTRLATLSGQRRVEQLRIGDLVLTQDNGPQPVQWIGRRHMSEARLFAEPAFRPVRIRAGALGVDRPDQELLVSPQHRMLVSSDAARDLFDTTDVLVAAKDLIDGRAITVDLAVREVTYIHVLLPGHNILWANGVPTESFHPASASLHLLTAEDRSALLAALPGLAGGADCYGGYARRNLTKAEAAVLRHAA